MPKIINTTPWGHPRHHRPKTPWGQQPNPPSTRHGHRGSGNLKSPTYQSWSAMRTRCTNEKSNDWKLYGGAGVEVCERWWFFENFLEDMGERPRGKTLDRINPNGNYEPGNCRWATPKEQTQNRRLRKKT
jgi:hypothetical protein